MPVLVPLRSYSSLAEQFTSAYLLKGYRGGRSAALDLRNKVNSLVHNRYRQVAGPLARPPEVYVVAQSFLNMVGLSNHLRCVDLRSFAQGFSSSGLAFSMIDVGSQKQAADEAIKAHLPFLLATCDVVLLGGSHDGGYAADLLRLDPEVLRTKVLLLRTTDFAAERILELGLDEVRFEGLFDGTDPSSGRKPGTSSLPPCSSRRSRATSTLTPFFLSYSLPHTRVGSCGALLRLELDWAAQLQAALGLVLVDGRPQAQRPRRRLELVALVARAAAAALGDVGGPAVRDADAVRAARPRPARLCVARPAPPIARRRRAGAPGEVPGDGRVLEAVRARGGTRGGDPSGQGRDAGGGLGRAR